MSTRVLALVGSLRTGSYNRQLAEAAIKHAPDGIQVEIFDGLAELPFYNEDIDRRGAVPSADRLRAAVESADALLFLTPEYNETMPALLKNAIDWLSRPFRASAIVGKPVAIIGAAESLYGGARAQADVRKAASAAEAIVVTGVKLAVPHARTRFANIHPAADDEIANTLPAILDGLAAAVHAYS